MSKARIWQLAARKITNDATLEELQELEQLLKDEPDLAWEIELHNRYFDHREEPAGATNNSAWERQLTRMETEFPEHFGQQAPPKAKRVRGVYWLAAAATIICVSIWALLRNGAGEKAPPLTEISALDKKYEIMLPDGTKAILNKNTHLYLSSGFGKSNRDVILDGEAFFDVTHNKEIPFHVNAATVRIKVLGTAFNVRAYADETNVETSLLRGLIEITDSRQRDMKIVMNPNEKVTIGRRGKSKGDSLSPNSPQKKYFYQMEMLKDPAADGLMPETAWTEGKLVFERKTLADVAVKLEKWYGVSIDIRSERLAQEKFTGVFENVDIRTALQGLQTTYPFHYEISGTTIIISEK